MIWGQDKEFLLWDEIFKLVNTSSGIKAGNMCKSKLCWQRHKWKAFHWPSMGIIFALILIHVCASLNSMPFRKMLTSPFKFSKIHLQRIYDGAFQSIDETNFWSCKIHQFKLIVWHLQVYRVKYISHQLDMAEIQKCYKYIRYLDLRICHI